MASSQDAKRTGSFAIGCVATARPAQLAAVLRTLRPSTAQIVVAAHVRIEPETLGPLVDVADTVVRFEGPVPADALWRWLAAQCTGAPVLLVGDDEVPSAALRGALPLLAADDGVDRALIARQWLFPGPESWLAERPWWPDFRSRLVVRHVGGPAGHPLAPAIGPPTRYVEEPLYDLSCLTSGFAARRRRANHGADDVPTDLPVEHAAVLLNPEHFATRRPVATAPDDLDVLRAVVAAAEERSSAPALPIVTAASIVAAPPPMVPGRPSSPVELAVIDRDMRVDPGHDASILVAVTNLGTEPLRRAGGREPGTWLTCRLLDRRPGAARRDWLPTALPGDIPPGETRVVPVTVPIPPASGTYIGELSIVVDDERPAGREPITFELAVTSRWGRFSARRP